MSQAESTWPAPQADDRRNKKDPKPAIVEVDSDGDHWLKVSKHRRRLLSRDEFFELARRGGMTVIPAK